MATRFDRYDNGLKGETRDMHREFTFDSCCEDRKVSQRSGQRNPRRVCLDEDDRNELALSLAGPSDPERKQLSTNGVKGAICPTSTKSSQLLWLLKLYEVWLKKKIVRKCKALDSQGDSDAALLPIQNIRARSSNLNVTTGMSLLDSLTTRSFPSGVDSTVDNDQGTLSLVKASGGGTKIRKTDRGGGGGKTDV
ncbi:hypothetical protein F2Q68_00031127, partial [Brassica cretica]